jgi:hypothetical protein
VNDVPSSVQAVLVAFCVSVALVATFEVGRQTKSRDGFGGAA